MSPVELSYLYRHDSMYAIVKQFTCRQLSHFISIGMIQYTSPLNRLHVACWVFFSYLCQHDSMYAIVKQFTYRQLCYLISIDMIQYTSPLNRLYVAREFFFLIFVNMIQYMPSLNSLLITSCVILSLSTWFNIRHR